MEHNCYGLQTCSPGFRRAKGNKERNLAWWVFGGLLGVLNSKFFISLAEIIIQNKSNLRKDVWGLQCTPSPHQIISDRRKRNRRRLQAAAGHEDAEGHGGLNVVV